MTDSPYLAACLRAVCDPDLATNPVAWFELERAGLTREALREASDLPEWNGTKPLFDKAPARDCAMWSYLEAQSGSDNES